GLFTAITMIVGIVIGSGIFFKSDNILVATNGNVTMGVLVFCLAALCVIFGCLNIAELASRTEGTGGIIAYAEKFVSKKASCVFGWFYTLLYYPTLIVVVAWVIGIYSCMLFGIDGTLENQVLIGGVFIVFLYIVNSLSAKLGGYFQNASTIIKIIPLVMIAIYGLFFSDFTGLTPENIELVKSTSWIAAIAPIAFSFDGWIVATSISHEVKNSKRNLPLALIIGPIFVLIIYVAYFVGISILVGPENIMALGDEHVSVAANAVLGATGAKVILVFVIVSVIGTVNGLIMGFIRLPYSLALRELLPKSDFIKVINKKYEMPINSAIISSFITLFWFVVHYLTQKLNLLPNSDVSEISVVMSYVLYCMLYIAIFKMGTSGEIKGFLKGRFYPVMGMLGSLVILTGGAKNPLFIYYALFCILVIITSIVFFNKTQENKMYSVLED
ncbi:MAG: APC family permease, partial [Clostridium sp.]